MSGRFEFWIFFWVWVGSGLGIFFGFGLVKKPRVGFSGFHVTDTSLLLGLTIKAHKKKKTHIVIPNRPIYHNDEHLNDEEIEMGNYEECDDYDIFKINLQIFVLENFKDTQLQMLIKISQIKYTALY